MNINKIAADIFKFTELLNTDGSKGFTLKTKNGEYQWNGMAGGYADLAQCYDESHQMMRILSHSLANCEPMSEISIEWHEDNSEFFVITPNEEDALFETQQGLRGNSLLRHWFMRCIDFMYGGFMQWSDVCNPAEMENFADFIAAARES